MANLVRRDPFTDLAASFQRDIEHMFRSAAENFGGLETVATSRVEWMPAADVLTRGDDIVFRLELPGIDPERDVEITAEDSTIRVRGQRVDSDEERNDGYVRRETSVGAFERVLRLPGGVNADDLNAKYENGILEIVIPGGAKRPTQRVPVEVKHDHGEGPDSARDDKARKSKK